jgi:hypothetical protein
MPQPVHVLSPFFITSLAIIAGLSSILDIEKYWHEIRRHSGGYRFYNLFIWVALFPAKGWLTTFSDWEKENPGI